MGKAINIIEDNFILKDSPEKERLVFFSLTNNQSPHKEDYRIIVDSDNFFLIEDGGWYVHLDRGKAYVRRNVGNSTEFLHWYIARTRFKGRDSKYVIDHINGNSLDNRRSNLRVLSRSENAKRNAESVDYKGLRITFLRTRKLWQCYDKKKYIAGGKHLGRVMAKIDKELAGREIAS